MYLAHAVNDAWQVSVPLGKGAWSQGSKTFFPPLGRGWSGSAHAIASEISRGVWNYHKICRFSSIIHWKLIFSMEKQAINSPKLCTVHDSAVKCVKASNGMMIQNTENNTCYQCTGYGEAPCGQGHRQPMATCPTLLAAATDTNYGSS